MSIKVLRHGDSIFPIQITCQKCGALLMVEKPLDLKIIDNPSTERVGVFDCPDCQSQMVLYDSDMPQALAEYDKAVTHETR